MVLKNLTMGKYQDCKTRQTLTFVGYAKMRKYSYARFITWINATVSHIDTKIVLSRYIKFLA